MKQKNLGEVFKNTCIKNNFIHLISIYWAPLETVQGARDPSMNQKDVALIFMEIIFYWEETNISTLISDIDKTGYLESGQGFWRGSDSLEDAKSWRWQLRICLWNWYLNDEKKPAMQNLKIDCPRQGEQQRLEGRKCEATWQTERWLMCLQHDGQEEEAQGEDKGLSRDQTLCDE